MTDWKTREAFLVDDSTGEILERHSFADLEIMEKDALRRGALAVMDAPDWTRRSLAKPGMDIASQTDRALAELAEYRKTLR